MGQLFRNGMRRCENEPPLLGRRAKRTHTASPRSTASTQLSVRAVLAAWTGITLTCLLCGCQVLADYEDFSESAEPQEGCQSLPISRNLSRSVGGTAMNWTVVRVDAKSTCSYMDETEVTVKHYRAWAESNSAVAWDTRCSSWKRVPPDNKPAPPSAPWVDGDSCGERIDFDVQFDPWNPGKPTRCVDWCDAQAFCKGRGGRLCYSGGGGGITEPADMPPEWTTACTNREPAGGQTAWPWGEGLESDCVLNQPAHGCFGGCGPAVLDPKQPRCKNSRGVFDLIGNVKEWLLGCDSNDQKSEKGTCKLAGGGYDDKLESTSCLGTAAAAPRIARDPDIGFRCCYDLDDVP
jgi:formylglycine-generating enzyme required for sulfatase activity